jgi:hypothetical protein
MTKPALINEDEAAAYIGMSAAYLQAGRSRGVIGKRTPTPPFYKIGRLVKYSTPDLDQYLIERRVDPAARKILSSARKPK